MLLPLLRHPDTPSAHMRKVTAAFDASGEEALAIRYRVEGSMDRLRMPERTTPTRTDELWKHTCFEVFVGRRGSPGYFEFNFSPSGEWAAYRFAGYRAGMAAADGAQTPQISTARKPSLLEVDVLLPLAGLDELEGEDLRVGVSAVLEEQDGQKSYWALIHPAGKPDFHHPDSFALTLPARAGVAR